MCSKLIILIVLFVLFLALPISLDAAVLINEISPSTDPEWIELYNDGDTDTDVTGFLLEDGNTSHSDDLHLIGIISAKSFLVFTHSEGWLNNGGDSLKLYNNASPSAIIDQYTYGNVNALSSVSRIPNGSETWVVTSSITKGELNPSPTPVPTTTPTFTPTSSPTPSPSPTTSSTPTVAPTLKPTPTKTTPTPNLVSTESGLVEDDSFSSGSSVLGVSWNDLAVGTESGKLGRRLPFLEDKNKIAALTFLILGICFIGGSVYFGYKTSKSSKSKNDI